MGLCLRRLRLQYPLQGWQGSSGISGSFQAESVAAFKRNQWQPSTGIGGRFRPESVATFARNTHPFFPDPGTEPFPNKAHYPPIIDSVAEHFPQSSPVNTVEISTDICIHDPTNTLRHAPLP